MNVKMLRNMEKSLPVEVGADTDISVRRCELSENLITFGYQQQKNSYHRTVEKTNDVIDPIGDWLQIRKLTRAEQRWLTIGEKMGIFFYKIKMAMHVLSK